MRDTGHDGRRWLRAGRRAAIGAVASLAIALAATPGAAFADTATLGHVCAPRFNFTITATETVPAGSTWQVTTSRGSDLVPFQAVPNTTAVQRVSGGATHVRLQAVQALPAGTVVQVMPSYYNIPYTGWTTLTISGEGGSYQQHFSRTDNPC